MPVLRLYAVIREALNSKNRIGEIGDPCGIPVAVGKLLDRNPGSLMRVLLLLRNDTIYGANWPRRSCLMLCSSRSYETLLYVPATSSSIIDTFLSLPYARCIRSRISWIT